jgi:hypothetical protein
MSTEYDNLDPNDPELVKKLRAIIDSKDKSIKELSTENEKFKGEKRTTTLAEKISAKGLNPKIAGIVPKDLGDDDLDSWLTEYAEVFGGPSAGEQQDPNAAVAAEATRMALAQEGSSSGNPGDPLTRIQGAQNWDQLNAVLKSL